MDWSLEIELHDYRERELVFLGMRPSITENVDREAQLKNAYIMRKQEQKDNKDAYERALEDMKEVVYNDEGPDMKRELEGRTHRVVGGCYTGRGHDGHQAGGPRRRGESTERKGRQEKAGERGLMPCKNFTTMQEPVADYDDKYPEPVEEEPEADPKADAKGTGQEGR